MSVSRDLSEALRSSALTVIAQWRLAVEDEHACLLPHPPPLTQLTSVLHTRSLASDSRPMSAQEPVIAVSNETSESDRVDSSTVPPSEHPTAKAASSIPDSSPAEPVIELPAETAQTVSDDTLLILPKDDTNIPTATSTDPNGSTNEAEATPSVSVELLLNFSLSPFRP